MLSKQGKNELHQLQNPDGTIDWLEVNSKRKLYTSRLGFLSYLPWHDHISKHWEIILRLFSLRFCLGVTKSLIFGYWASEFSARTGKQQPFVYILLDSRKQVKNTLYLWGKNVLK